MIINEIGDTQLMVYIKEKNKAKIFHFFLLSNEVYYLDHINYQGDSALTLSIHQDMYDIALEIIDYSNQYGCKMSHIDKHGNSALTLAIHRNMEVVAIEIVKTLCANNNIFMIGI